VELAKMTEYIVELDGLPIWVGTAKVAMPTKHWFGFNVGARVSKRPRMSVGAVPDTESSSVPKYVELIPRVSEGSKYRCEETASAISAE